MDVLLLELKKESFLVTNTTPTQIEPSIFMQDGLRKLDCNRIKKMNHKSSAKGKIRKKQLRAIKKGYIDIEKELEKEPL